MLQLIVWAMKVCAAETHPNVVAIFPARNGRRMNPDHTNNMYLFALPFTMKEAECWQIRQMLRRRLKNIQTWCMGKDRNWTDIPYHYLIAPDGTVYEGRNVNTVGETNTEYDPTGHLLICFLGNYRRAGIEPAIIGCIDKANCPFL